MKNLIAIAIFLSVNFNLFSQELSEERRLVYTNILYSADSAIFNKSTHNVYKFETYTESDYFKKSVTSEEIMSCTQLAKETAQLSLNEKEQLVLTCKLTERFNKQTVGILSVDFVESNLTKANGDKFELYTFYNSNSGYGKVSFKIDVKSTYAESEKITGFVTFQFNYLVGYDKVELTRTDIGKTITLNNCQYKIVSFRENEIVLDEICKSENEINVINFNENGEVAKPYSYMILLGMIEKDSTISTENSTVTRRKTYKMVRDLFEKQPQISYKEFNDFFTNQKLIEMMNEGRYTILSTIAPIGTKFILYCPKFKSEIIKVEMK